MLLAFRSDANIQQHSANSFSMMSHTFYSFANIQQGSINSYLKGVPNVLNIFKDRIYNNVEQAHFLKDVPCVLSIFKDQLLCNNIAQAHFLKDAIGVSLSFKYATT